MDSMRSLNTSLPKPYSSRPAPPEGLIQAFRTAALSVTNLYKSAVADQNNSRSAGYQDALEDLLSFLDRENLGLQDGEGWRVRQWATERYDGAAIHQNQSEEDEDKSDTDHANQASIPTVEPASESSSLGSVPQQSRSASEPANDFRGTQSETNLVPIFRFQGRQTNHANDEMQTDTSGNAENAQRESSTDARSGPVKVELRSTGNRQSNRSNTSRHNARSSNREFTFTAGTKRKIQFPDFFDIANVDVREDGASGSKRNRVV